MIAGMYSEVYHVVLNIKLNRLPPRFVQCIKEITQNIGNTLYKYNVSSRRVLGVRIRVNSTFGLAALNTASGS